MKFRTEIEIPNYSDRIEHSAPIFTIGSCFASSIGARLSDSKFNVVTNPMGVIFNPLSIASALERLDSCRVVERSELRSSQGVYYHYDFHSSLSSVDPTQALDSMNRAVVEGHNALKSCQWLIITLGTMWVYELVESGDVVANCHKEPARNFVRRAATLSEITQALSSIVERYPSKRVIFSISPIRHIADGLVDNSLSKATLRVAVESVTTQYSNALYFPSFEILVDDLRDYRFYAEDMVHPTTQAVDYIWQRFSESLLSNDVQRTIEIIRRIVQATQHRPQNPLSEAHREFCRKQLEEIKKYPNIDFGKESAYFESQLEN